MHHTKGKGGRSPVVDSANARLLDTTASTSLRYPMPARGSGVVCAKRCFAGTWLQQR